MSTTDRINYEASKDPDTLEREIDEQRAEISDTLAALEQKFSPGELFDKVLGYARGNGGEFMHNLTDTVRANPVPTVLTAVGLAWLMAGQNRRPAPYGTSYSSHTGSGITDKARQLKASVSDRLHSAGQQLSDGSHRLGDGAHRLSDSGHRMGASVSDSLHQSADSMRYQAERARQGFDTLLREQPLALGAIGIAVGALLGGLLPPTRREDEMLGETADRLKSRASELARQGAEQARARGEQLTEEARQHSADTTAGNDRSDTTGGRRAEDRRTSGALGTGGGASTGMGSDTATRDLGISDLGTGHAPGATQSGAGDINRAAESGQSMPRSGASGLGTGGLGTGGLGTGRPDTARPGTTPPGTPL